MIAIEITTSIPPEVQKKWMLANISNRTAFNLIYAGTLFNPLQNYSIIKNTV